MRRRARRHGLAGLAVLGAVVIAGLVAAWGVSPGGTVEISPADVVALRFPPDWNDDATADATPDTAANDDTTGSAPAAPSQSFALASAESKPVDANVLFNPHPTLALPAGTTALALAEEPQATAPRAPARVELKPETKAAAKPESKPATRTAAAPTRSLGATAHPAPRARKDSGMLFNDAQLASIKSRLKLSEYQEQYWPPVETALRQIGWRAAHEAGRAGNAHARLAEIDPDSPEVEQLKSAAFPLIMSMNDDQKREVRMLAQVMGLERVAASF
jgi:hypothetical protein